LDLLHEIMNDQERWRVFQQSLQQCRSGIGFTHISVKENLSAVLDANMHGSKHQQDISREADKSTEEGASFEGEESDTYEFEEDEADDFSDCEMKVSQNEALMWHCLRDKIQAKIPTVSDDDTASTVSDSEDSLGTLSCHSHSRSRKVFAHEWHCPGHKESSTRLAI
jgi:hypothetical protein